MTSLLSVRNLQLNLTTRAGVVQALRGVDFHLEKGETLAIVGESGCGKSMTALSLCGLLPPRAELRGEVMLAGQSLLQQSEKQWRQWRGNRLAMIFQNPMSALNPTMTVGQQIFEVLKQHRNIGKKQGMKQVEALLTQLQLTQPAKRMKQYPFELSGGMLQRVMIAMAVICDPELLIADEPTTALDVTVQAEVLALLKSLQRERQMGLLMITHDLAVVAQIAQRVAVMYAGQIVEQGTVADIFHSPSHPYTQGLLASLPSRQIAKSEGLQMIAGSPPSLINPPKGCSFSARCSQVMQLCPEQQPPVHQLNTASRCWLPSRDALLEEAGK